MSLSFWWSNKTTVSRQMIHACSKYYFHDRISDSNGDVNLTGKNVSCDMVTEHGQILRQET